MSLIGGSSSSSSDSRQDESINLTDSNDAEIFSSSVDAGRSTSTGHDNEVVFDYSTTVIDGGAFEFGSEALDFGGDALDFGGDAIDLVEVAIGAAFNQAGNVLDKSQQFTATQADTFRDSLAKINQNVASTLSGGQSEILKTLMLAFVAIVALWAFKK